MAIDRKLWEMRFYDNRIPPWPCPRCRATLSLLAESLKYEFDHETEKYKKDKDSDPEAYTGVFVCILQCTHKDCKETCAISGTFETTFNEQGYCDEYIPHSVIPPLELIRIPERCPESIRKETDKAKLLFWSDNSACLNRIRSSLELLLDNLRIPRATNDFKIGKRRRHTLHARIELLQSKRPDLKTSCERMMAVKHLGNAGSHPGENVVRKDVYDGFDILERVLNDVYSGHESELAIMVRQINRRKGPRKQ